MILLNLLKKDDDIAALWTGLLSGFFEKYIRKHFGYDVNIDIQDASIVTNKETVRMHLNLDVEMSKEEYKMIMRNLKNFNKKD